MGPRALTFQAADGTRLRFLLHLPPGHGGDAGGRWPLVLSLHGAGERGHEPSGVLVHGLPQRLLAQPGFPALVLAPLCPPDSTWLELAPALLELLDEAVARLGADPARVHVTGLSMGGMGAWWLGLLAPERFASVVPVCGLVPPVAGLRPRLARLAARPVWAFHGEDDPVVPVAESRRMVGWLEELGGRPRLTTYPGVGHAAWEQAYADPALEAWLLR